ncbi:MAG: NAD-dependent deacetylase [Magnetococcales bacterium]|nr:NAD-dependent deacetylase [Magnetococcales bacterium]MBF0322098.1 NAD-dependent deacetylase [Magnetococcales bacterium]
MSLATRYRNAARVVAEADALLITAGAGMGVDSGLPDFRGDTGFWQSYPVLARQGLSFAEMANPQWFRQDPHLAWAFYGHRLNLYRRTEPHAGFAWLLALIKSKPAGGFVLTSNVDHQFQKAGFDPERIEECHGSIEHLQCTTPCHQEIWSAASTQLQVDETRFRALDPLPRCPRCDHLARPNILMFGDSDWLGHRTTQQEERLHRWLDDIQTNNQRIAIIELGAGLAVPTIRYRSEAYAARLGGVLIRINPRDHEVSDPSHISLPVSAAVGIASLSATSETAPKGVK